MLPIKQRLRLIVAIFLSSLAMPSTVFSSTATSSSASLGYVVVDHDIEVSTEWDASAIYIITAEVHVLAGVTLTVADGTEIRIVNGRQLPSQLGSNALVFDSGSRLKAGTMRVMAADAKGEPEAVADNAGIWFLGSWRAASKDGLEVTAVGSSHHSRFQAEAIETSYLGRPDRDPTGRHYPGGDDDAEFGDDIDGISILGVGPTEWRVNAVSSLASGDDGFDVTNSTIAMDTLTVDAPTEDGMNISSSNVAISRQLSIDMTRSKSADRGLFDLEVDDGPSRVIMRKNSRANLSGYFGDELVIESSDMPMPREGRFFRFTGAMETGSTEVYLNDEMNPQTVGRVNSGQ
ncbi:MAG: hypothetical protein FJ146_17925 [Deltaproteobacteria bacterium]|nr:hypothetical protein [Deltaproteobacteria bacterium]